MPFTVNGFGAMYYGKSKVHERPGVCVYCQKMTELKSYETRLWIVCVYIPVIPLGKKQILDLCPLCSKHQVASMGQWQQASEEAIRNAVQQAEAQPDDPTAAIELIVTLSSYQRHEDASRYSQIVAENFSDNAEVQGSLGAWHDSEGRSEQADAYYHRVLEIEPDHQGAKRALAISLMNQGEIEPAREMLSFLDQPEAPPDPQMQSLLAETYHARGEHESALEHYARLIEETPQVAENPKFRKRVRRSEKAVGREESILPYSPWRLGPMFTGMIALVVLILSGYLYNVYWKTHQTVHVINGFHTTISVSIDEGNPLTVPPMQRKTVSIAEGDHLAIAKSEGIEFDRIDFRISNTLGQRLFGNPTFVLNPGAAGTLLSETVIYRSGPARDTPNPMQLYFGKTWFVFRGLDYPFEEPPDELTMDSEKESVSKRCLVFFPAEPSVILGSLPETYPVNRKLDYIEYQLSRNPEDVYLILWYSSIATRNPNLLRQARDFLHPGLDHRPIVIEWHRQYQVLTASAGDSDSLVPLYERMLAEDPENSRLLYLRGRLAARASEVIAYCDRALDADPENTNALVCKAYHLSSQGKFEEAKTIVEQALQFGPIENDALYFWIRFALGEYEALESELREILRQSPFSITDQRYYLAVLFAQGKENEAKECYQAFFHLVRRDLSSNLFNVEQLNGMAFAYLESDIEMYLKNARELGPSESSAETFAAMIEMGELKQAEPLFDKGLDVFSRLESGPKALLLSLAWSEKGEQDKTDQWYQTAIRYFSEGDSGAKQIAALLQAGDTLTLDDVDESSANIEVKATVLIALARKNDRHREALLDRARKLIVPGFFPNRFLNRMLDASAR